ncbi:tRNA-splicing endonuclease subunit Sen34 isoform X2 [Glossina fuscipes]|uniref:tRNA-splicing endonuclease subunit Sen34 n=1 Tax=Glossina fuscipes TaxID=7396 RepID=A0A8U0W604_9MUSC|nr:tRNA-splicing endonuclease subunit Sen34 isoform X2 [Glossina fuscipes]
MDVILLNSRRRRRIENMSSDIVNVPKHKIILTLLNGTGYIFEIKDYMFLRKHHHILGALVGSCNARGCSPNEQTLPIALTSLETQLLVEEGIAVIVSKATALLKTPTELDLRQYKDGLNDRLTEQAETLKHQKLKDTEINLDKIMNGKRKKLLQKGIPETEVDLNPQQVLKEIADNITFDRKNALLEICCAHPDKHIASIVQLPPLEEHSLKYLVFRDFWLRGKFVTSGDTFGADFLIYPGDPLLYHASHIVVLLDHCKVEPLELIAKVRLSVIVNKHCVFAYLSEHNAGEKDYSKICYQTVYWEGNQERERSKQ